jgi:hypothetical protein
MKVTIKASAFKNDQTVRKVIAAFLDGCKPEQFISFEIKKTKAVTLAQYGYLYGVVYPCIAAFYQSVNGSPISIGDIDNEMKEMFWNTPVQGINGKVVKYRANTKTKMNRDELGSYIDKVISWATDNLGCEIPPPAKDEGDQAFFEQIDY